VLEIDDGVLDLGRVVPLVAAPAEVQHRSSGRVENLERSHQFFLLLKRLKLKQLTSHEISLILTPTATPASMKVRVTTAVSAATLMAVPMAAATAVTLAAQNREQNLWEQQPQHKQLWQQPQRQQLRMMQMERQQLR
jgi:hypothetical protein